VPSSCLAILATAWFLSTKLGHTFGLRLMYALAALPFVTLAQMALISYTPLAGIMVAAALALFAAVR
jgi:hypothetical protein